MTDLTPEQRLAMRKARVVQLTRHAQFKGLIVTTATVSKNFRTFNRWYTGILTTGQLMRLTGVKKRETP